MYNHGISSLLRNINTKNGTLASPCTNASLVFDGIDDVVHIYNSSLVLDTAFTVELWLYPSAMDNQNRFIIGTTPANASEQAFALAVIDSTFAIIMGNVLIAHTVTTGSVLSPNTGIVNAVDRATVRNASSTMGYTPADVTLDGIVNAADRVAVLNNRFAVGQVP